VVGFVDPRQMLTKGGARVGDALVLTKPLGFGVTTTALKRELASEEDVNEVVQWMTRLNKDAGKLTHEFSLRGGTDITGFGLLGHGLEMANASGVGFKLKLGQIPFVSSARKYAAQFTFPGGAADNRLYFGKQATFADGIEEFEQMLLFDPQTSGGLLLAVPQEKLDAFLARAKEINQPIWIVGEAVAGQGIDVVK
jgi:selenide,water dikinase